MKTKLITLLALSWTMVVSAQTADSYITAGTNDLVIDNLWGADTNFSAALAVSPTNETANLLKSATRLLVLPQTPAGSNFLVTLGFPNTNRWLPHVPEAGLPEDVNGYPIFPANYNSTNIVAFFRTNILAAIAASGTNLANITDPNYTLSLSSNETSFTLSPGQIFTESVTLDYGDIQMLRALLSAAQFMGYTLNANNFSVVMPQVGNMFETHTFTWQWVLTNYPNLLTMQNTADLASSKSALTNAIGYYFAASSFIRNTRPAGATNRLFELDTNDIGMEAKFRTELTNALASLNTPTEFNTNDISSTLYAGAYFAGTHSLQSLMPQFNGDTYVNDSLPDYTFGGVWPYQPAYRTEHFFRKEFYSYAGIYAGSVYDLNYNDRNAGRFAAFVSTNQQATIVGYDIDSFQHYNGQAGGVAAQFNVEKDDYWQFGSNSVDGVNGDYSYGSIGKDGSFDGYLYFTNRDSVQLNGFQPSQQSPVGPFQNAAGLYSGSGSGAFGGQTVPFTLSIVLTADGYFTYCVFVNGTENDGGWGQLGSNSQFTNMTSASGSTVIGTLNSSTFQITGTVTNASGGGTWTMTRSANVPFDVPPVITTNLPANITALVGTNVTLFLVATGSPPMCFQWYSNGVAIPNATTNTLGVSNLQYRSAGTYSVSVNNAAGGTNAAVVLTVATLDTGATFTITPSAVSNTDIGTITLQVTGLNSNETVTVQKYLDLNTNGVIDGGDWLVQQFSLTDGQAGMVIGGVTNFNVPGDTDGTANGQITATLNFQNGDFVQNIVGEYLYKLSSSVGLFTPITNQFVVTNFPYAQKFTGNVVSNGTSATVPNAVVLLCQSEPFNGGPWEGVVANNTGSYTLLAPPGTYSLVAFSSNYVANMGTPPVLTLSSGQTATTNLTMTQATASISGNLVDAGNSSIALPGVNVLAQSAIGLTAVTFTDTNGNYTVPVTSGTWDIHPSAEALLVHGYVALSGTNVNTSTTGVTLAVPKATALIYGRVTNNLGNPFAGIDVYANENNNNLYETDVYTDTNGNYVLGVIALGANDSWWMEANGDDQLTNYVFSDETIDGVVNAGQAVLQNFTGILATNYITGWLRDNYGNPIAGVGVSADGVINGIYYRNYVETGVNGTYSLNVGNGTWDVYINIWGGDGSLPGNYLPPSDQTVVIANNNGIANFTATFLPLQVTTTSLPNGTRNTTYSQQLSAAYGQLPYSWSLLSGSLPSGLTLATNGVISGTPVTSGTFNFTVQVTDATNGTAIQPLALTVSVLATNLVLNGGFETGDFSGWITGGNFTYTSVTTGSAYAHSGTDGAQLGPPGSLGFISQTLTTTAGTSYLLSFWLDSPDGQTPNEFLVSWNGNTIFDETYIPAIGWTNLQFVVSATGNSTVLEFGFRDDPSYLGLDDISVVASQPAQLTVTTASLPSGTTNVAYSQTLTASGGQTPYTWTNISGVFPPGLTLATNGVISGTPTSNGTFNFTVKVTDALSATATQPLTLNVLAPPNNGVFYQIPTTEYDALVDLYNSTGGNAWTTQTGWLNPNATSWSGIGISGVQYDINGNVSVQGNVTVINLQQFGLSGNIPASIGNFSQLYYLRLSFNQLTGSIPNSIGNLQQLWLLYLHYNNLNGPIPDTMGNLPNLQYLYLVNNNLSGAIPSSLGNLTGLLLCGLGENQLSGSIPASFGNLINVTGLTFNDNLLAGSIPSNFTNLSSVQSLQLEDNQLSGVLPTGFSSLTNLQSLNVAFNQLSGNIPDIFGNLTQLIGLGLNNNQFTGVLPTSLCSLTSLQSLSVASNQLDGNIPLLLGPLNNASLDPDPSEFPVGANFAGNCFETTPGTQSRSNLDLMISQGKIIVYSPNCQFEPLSVMYSFTGPTFGDGAISYEAPGSGLTSSTFISASITYNSVLAPNLRDFTSDASSQPDLPSNWLFSDGVEQWTPANSHFYVAQVDTDANGNITGWDFDLYSNPGLTDPEMYIISSTPSSYGSEEVNLSFTAPYATAYCFYGPGVDPTTWTLSITLPVILSAPQITVGKTNFTFLLSGPAGSNYVLQVSTNLLNWNPVSTSTIPVSGTISLTNAISGFNRCFYKVHLQ